MSNQIKKTKYVNAMTLQNYEIMALLYTCNINTHILVIKCTLLNQSTADSYIVL